MAKPAYRAYTVIKREDKDDYWLNLGACYPHEDGEGFNLLLNALPVDAKLVLRCYKEKPEEQEAESRRARSTSRSSDRSPARPHLEEPSQCRRLFLSGHGSQGMALELHTASARADHAMIGTSEAILAVLFACTDEARVARKLCASCNVPGCCVERSHMQR
jgi:hypothetical protein